MMTRRDDLCKRDPTSLELPRVNYDIRNYIYVHKRRHFVETLDQMTNVTKLWGTIKIIDGRAKREAENEVNSFNGSSFSSSKQLGTNFNTPKLGRHTSSGESCRNSKAFGPDKFSIFHLKHIGPRAIDYMLYTHSNYPC